MALLVGNVSKSGGERMGKMIVCDKHGYVTPMGVCPTCVHDDYAVLANELSSLRQENERLRQALEKISKSNCLESESEVFASRLMEIAEEALEGKGGK